MEYHSENPYVSADFKYSLNRACLCAQSCPPPRDPTAVTASSSVLEILQARIPEKVAVSSCRGSS